ncbi:MAG: hypothetical protein A07HR60_00397 [uncultured archaeon A07HR60]|nr:MAG: hypothetical protein A07HR60_00397 [uncultured archaeon A07HR60]
MPQRSRGQSDVPTVFDVRAMPSPGSIECGPDIFHNVTTDNTTRRRVIGLVVGTGAIALAGCTDNPDDSGGSDGSGDSGQDDSSDGEDGGGGDEPGYSGVNPESA